MLQELRRTKIVATLGPASDTPAQIERLVAAGADIFRLNFSHGTHQWHAATIAAIRAHEAGLNRPLCILQDLQGPKIRCGVFAGGKAEVVAGQEFRLTVSSAPGTNERCGLDFPPLLTEVTVGQRLLLRDGLVELRVAAVEPEAIVGQVVVGGTLTSHCGINVPDADLAIPALDEQDLADLAFGAEHGVDWVALSFVRTAGDLQLAREAMHRLGSQAKLMAKIEKPGAVERFEELLALSDGIMVARGDLGVELPPERVPVIQKQLIRACVAAGKPVVVATQMLESMLHNPRPTRAEASDVANAIYDLADAVMLSGETATGQYPVEALRIMDAIAAEVEASEQYRRQLFRFYPQELPSVADAVSHSACRIAQILPADCVACFTWSGSTARRIARHRPDTLIAALTPFQPVARQLALSWGIIAQTACDPTNSDHMTSDAIRCLSGARLIQPGHKVVVMAGVPFGQPGTTNMLRVEEVE